jgi:hypothetical protein
MGVTITGIYRESYVEKSILKDEKYLHGGQITLKAKVTVT